MRLPSKKKIILGSLLGVALYSGIYAYAVNSDVYIAAKQEIMLSKKLTLKIGEIQSIRLPFFGRFKLHWEGVDGESMATARFKVEVNGALKSLNLMIRSKMTSDTWKIQSAEEDGRQIEL